MSTLKISALLLTGILALSACGDSGDAGADADPVGGETDVPEVTEAPETSEQPAVSADTDDHHDDGHSHDDAAVATAGDADEADATVTISLEVSDGDVVGGAQSKEVATGDVVLIKIVLDVADEAHLHGYDFIAGGDAGETVQIVFNASIPGVWELELEGAGLALLELVVS